MINARVDVFVDNMVVVQAWTSQGSRSLPLNRVLKSLFFTTVVLNISLPATYIPTEANPDIWSVVQTHFGGVTGHTSDFMALDSNIND